MLMDSHTRAWIVERWLRILVHQLSIAELTYVAEASPATRQALHEACISLADTIGALERREEQ